MDLETQLGKPIPEDVRNDPVKYEAFLQEQMRSEDPALRRRAESLVSSHPQLKEASAKSGGALAFLDRFRKGAMGSTIAKPMMGTSTRVKVVAVGQGNSEDKRASLLANADHV